MNHLLRVHGRRLKSTPEALHAFDAVAQTTQLRLFPGVTPEGFAQASLAPSLGGLGWRRACDTALPAHVGALVMAVPKVQSMIAEAARAGLVDSGALERRLQRQLDEAQAALMAELDASEQAEAHGFIEKCSAAARVQWSCLADGVRPRHRPPPRVDATLNEAGELVPASLPDDEQEDDEGGGPRTVSTQHLQRQLTKLSDFTRLRRLQDTLRSQCNWPQLQRLSELRHKEVSHRWLWHLDASKGTVLCETDYILNVQKRLGAIILEDDLTCRICGGHLDPALEHCETCATAEATKGHYACVRALVDGIKVADPSVSTEPRHLTSTDARPADILTNAAVPGRRAALDVCVTSPNAAEARDDAAASAFQRKMRHYAHIIPELHRAGITFRPLVWTADGRPHPAAMRTLRFAAERAARKHGGAGAGDILGRWKHEIMIAILRRRAAMARAVLPSRCAWETWMLWGRTEEQPASLLRAPPLEEDATPGEVDRGGVSHVVSAAGG